MAAVFKEELSDGWCVVGRITEYDLILPEKLANLIYFLHLLGNPRPCLSLRRLLSGVPLIRPSSAHRGETAGRTVLSFKLKVANSTIFQFSTDIKSLISGVVGSCHVFNISYWLEMWLLEENKSTTSGDNTRRLFQNKSCKPISLLFSFWGLWFESVLPALPFLTCDFRMIFNN